MSFKSSVLMKVSLKIRIHFVENLLFIFGNWWTISFKQNAFFESFSSWLKQWIEKQKCIKETKSAIENYYFSLDNDECANKNGGCGQLCINTPGTYECKCKVGYRMESNRKSCTGTFYYEFVLSFFHLVFHHNLNASKTSSPFMYNKQLFTFYTHL